MTSAEQFSGAGSSEGGSGKDKDGPNGAKEIRKLLGLGTSTSASIS